MRKPVAFCLAIEKQIHEGIGEELHRHGMDLGRITRGPVVFHRRLVLAQVHLKRMTYFMGEHVNIARCTIEIGEDERSVVSGDVSAIPTTCFSFLRHQVHQSVVQHIVDEAGGLC